MAYEMVMPYHLHMPSYFLETFTEYPYLFFIENPRECVKIIFTDYTDLRRQILQSIICLLNLVYVHPLRNLW